MTTTRAVHKDAKPHTPLFARISFAIMVTGWIAFAVAIVASQQTLDDIWTAVRDLPLIVELFVWLIAFPFLVGLAIWQASWDESTRLIAIAVLAIGYTLIFVPREKTE